VVFVKGAPLLFVLRIEHPVPGYDEWKQTFDNDPLDREKSGVRRHKVMRDLDNPNYVLIDLEFEEAGQARAMHEALQGLWGRAQSRGLIGSPQARIVEVVEAREYGDRR
jgi:hypothetical protein